MNLFEIFIRMFLDEVFVITKHGLKSAYITCCANEAFFKGKIKFQEHIKKNICHKEHVFVEFDEFNSNRPENRIIKSSLLYLQSLTRNPRSKKDIHTLLNAFDGVDISYNYQQDFSKCIENRNMKEYANAMRWSRIFLMNQGFTAFSGSNIAYAILFPMNQLFESYIAKVLDRALDKTKYTLHTQDKVHYLFDYPNKKFLIKPDIVIKQKDNGKTFVLDTKWKNLSSDYNNYGISQSDMYQMYAYDKKYDSSVVLLLYPLNSNVPEDEVISFTSLDHVTVKVMFIDLLHIDESIQKVLGQIT